jgi:adenine phosphoribosyltransferase
MSHAANAADPIAQLRERIRDIPDFPKPGILFKDVTPLLAHGPSFRQATSLLANRVEPYAPEVVVGIESRGFIFGAALAERLGLGFIPVRKPGKLPWRRIRETYALEYGTDALELHEDAVEGKRVAVIDDLLATGGTAGATGRLVERAGGRVAVFAFAVELTFLDGRKQLGATPCEALIAF